MRRQVMSILVENTPGLLSHVSGLFSRRGYNIDSFSAGVTADPRFTRITIVTSGDELILDNAGLMVLKLLKECGAGKVVLAGFDGFAHRKGSHYYSPELNLQTDAKTAALRQERIKRQINELQMDLQFLTRSVYEEKAHV